MLSANKGFIRVCALIEYVFKFKFSLESIFNIVFQVADWTIALMARFRALLVRLMYAAPILAVS